MGVDRYVRGLIDGALLIAGALSVSCGGVSDDPSGSGGAAAASGAGAVAGAAGAGGAGGTAGSAGVSGSSVVCAGVTCEPGQACCLASGECFDPTTNAGACQTPTTEPGPQGQQPCASSAHCAAGEYCQPTYGFCLGSGFCESKSNCGTSSGMPMCGCDGVTYPDVQTACGKGVAIVGTGECGKTQTIGAGGGAGGKTVTYCASSSACPSGQECCFITGQCYDATEPALCALPPEGTTFPCIDDSHCFAGIEYCAGEGCGGPGGCVSKPSTCTGELEPVCGCDGQSYVNAECAAVAGTRVAHAGECP